MPVENNNVGHAYIVWKKKYRLILDKMWRNMVDKYEDPFVKISAMIGGDEYLKVSRSLLKSEDATDEEIASSTGLRINMVRKVLYVLFGKWLFTGVRVKD